MNDFELRMPSGTDDPLSDSEIQTYRKEIDRLDRLILDAVKRRSEISRAIGKTRMGSGGTKLVHTREVAIITNSVMNSVRKGQHWPRFCCASAAANWDDAAGR